MKSIEDIVARVKGLQDDQLEDMFGFGAEVLMGFLPMQHLEQFLKEGARAELESDNWKDPVYDEAQVIKEMGNYMGFAIDKATDHRGLSADRSVQKMRAWLWLLGDDKTLEFADGDGNYRNYGAPILMCICEKYGFDIPGGVDFQRMADGLPCEPGCDMGCGR